MSYFLSPALETLRAQINARWPTRDKRSDGWIGDAAHNARPSDHNPDYSDGGIVRAIDVDRDGVDVDLLCDIILADSRTWYVIWNKRIRYGNYVTGVVQGWQPYTGTNSHEHHIHISVRKIGDYDRNASPWKFPGIITPPTPKGPLMALSDTEQTELLKKVRELHSSLYGLQVDMPWTDSKTRKTEKYTLRSALAWIASKVAR